MIIYQHFMLAFQEQAINKVGQLARQSGFYISSIQPDKKYGMQDIQLQKRQISSQLCS